MSRCRNETTDRDDPSFTIVTNGDEIFFVKLGQADRCYAVSRVFSPFVSGDELCEALKVLKRMGKVAGEIA